MRRCYTAKVWEELLKDVGVPGYSAYLAESAFRRLEFDVYEHVRSLFRLEAEPRELLALLQAHPHVSFSDLGGGSFIMSLNLRTMTEMARKLGCDGEECAEISRHLPIVSSSVAACLEGGREERFEGVKPSSAGTSETDFRVLPVQHLTTAQVLKLAGREMSQGELMKHSFATLEVEGISRAASHQLVRHRLFSYSQESQRFSDAVNESGLIPPSVASNREAVAIFNRQLEAGGLAYNKLRDLGIKKEDARFLLPTAIKTKILMTGSLRQIVHASFYRSSFSDVGSKAQWEINHLFTRVYEILRDANGALPEKIAEV